MSAASYHSSNDRPRRYGAALVALLIELLIALALLSLGAYQLTKPKVAQKLEVFDVRPQASAQKATARAHAKQTKTDVSVARSVAPPPPIKPSRPKPITLGPEVIQLDHDEFAKADIGKLPAHPEDGEDSASAGSGKGKAAYGPGEGPGGEPIYDVAWYRRPTDAELNGYLPHGAPPGGYALIACRMIDNYQVENCRALSESPVGSGLARAMRQAAWQFRVRPPRVGNKVQLGGWVRIRIDFGGKDE